MAIGFERRQASLIGAGDLPFARVTGAVPDLSSIGDIGRDMQLRARQKQAQTEADQAQVDAQNESIQGAAAGSSYVGKDENGDLRPFTLPDGSPTFRRAWQAAAESNLEAGFRSDFGNQLSAISQRIIAGNVKPEDAPRLMEEALLGALQATPPHLQASFRNYGMAEITQRTTYMAAKEAEQVADLTAKGLDAQIDNKIKTATAKAAAGLPTEQDEAEIAKTLDTLVELKRIPKEVAEIQKQGLREVIVAQGLTQRLASALNGGRIDPNQLDQFALGIENGSEFELLVPHQDALDQPDRPVVGYKTSAVIGNIKDERIRASVSQRLREAAIDYRQRFETNTKDAAFADEFARLGGADRRFDMLSSGNKDQAELFVQRIITEGRAFDDPNNMALLMGSLQRLKFAPRGLVSSLRNMTNSGDAKQIEQAVKVYQMMTQLQNQWGDHVGRAIYNDIPEGDRDVLDAYRDAYEFGVPPLDIRNAMMKLKGGDAVSMGDAIRNFNTMKGTDDSGFNKAFLQRWQGDFPGTFPLEAEDTFKRAYRMNLVLSGDAQHAFDKAYDVVKNRFTASDIFVRGVVKTGITPPENPYGYEASAKNLFGGNATGTKYEWLENDIRSDLVIANLSEDQPISKDQLANLLTLPQSSWGKPGTQFLGKTIKLEPTSTSATRPEFMLRVYDEQGNDKGYLEVTGPDGQDRPYTINPWARHDQMTQKALYTEKLSKLEAAKQSALDGKKQALWELYSRETYAGESFRPMPQTDDQFQQFLQEVPDQNAAIQYMIDANKITEGFKKQRQKLETETGIDLSKSKALDRTSLIMPRASGFDVTAAAVAAIDQVIPDGTGGQFMMRVAAHESRFGTVSGTFRPSGDRGIFQVNTSSGFVEVVNQVRSGQGRVYEASQKLKQQLGIDVAQLTAADLDRPVVAAAVGRLYFLVTSREIPQDVAGQAQLWKDHYNTRLGAGTAEQFVRSSSKVPADFNAAAYLTMDQG